jgi:hypothetical protein
MFEGHPKVHKQEYHLSHSHNKSYTSDSNIIITTKKLLYVIETRYQQLTRGIQAKRRKQTISQIWACYKEMRRTSGHFVGFKQH